MNMSKVILSQLGGPRFIAMTGAKNFVGSADALMFDVTGRGCNKVRVTLAGDDTYTLEAFKFSRKNLTLREVAQVNGVYVENLRACFTRLTGLHTSL